MLLTRIAPTPEPDEPKEPPPPQPEPKPEPAKQTRALPVIEQTESIGKQSITLEEFERLQKSGDNVILLDVRTERSRDTSDFQATGSVRIVPENVVVQAKDLKLPKEAWLIAYCA